MVRFEFSLWRDEAVSIGSCVSLYISLVSLSDLDVGTVGVRRPEVCNFDEISLHTGVVLNREDDTGSKGLVTPIPAWSKP
jgi:hypothetical protein